MKRFFRNIALCLLALLPFAATAPAIAATATGNYVCDNSTLTNFQSWSGAIHNAFIAFGWTQAPDSGQTIPSAAGSVPSNAYLYVIYKAADSLASTMPVYVKFEYGYSSTSPRIRFTVGTSSNGSGTITGVVTTSTPWEITTAAEINQGASTTFPSYFSGSGGEFRMYMWSTSTASTYPSTVFGIERSKTSGGADSADYITAFWANNSCCSNGAEQTLLPSAIGPYFIDGVVAIGVPTTPGTLSYAGTVAALPIFPLLGKIGNPMLGWMSVIASDISNNSLVTVTSMYGSTHTYLAVTPTQAGNYFCYSAGARAGGATCMGLLMRYE